MSAGHSGAGSNKESIDRSNGQELFSLINGEYCSRACRIGEEVRVDDWFNVGSAGCPCNGWLDFPKWSVVVDVQFGRTVDD